MLANIMRQGCSMQGVSPEGLHCCAACSLCWAQLMKLYL